LKREKIIYKYKKRLKDNINICIIIYDTPYTMMSGRYYSDNDTGYDNEYDNGMMTNTIDLEKLKIEDRGYTYVYRLLENENTNSKKKYKKNKNKKIELYSTGDFGSNIRDAVSGQYYPEKVGSTGEDLFFKVGLSTGERKSKNGSSTFFFLSPEQYERHMYATVSQEVKDTWLDKKMYEKTNIAKRLTHKK